MSAIIAPDPRWRSVDQLGNPNAYGEVYTYYDGTDVPAPTFQDAGMTIPNENPIKLNAAGEAIVYWDSTHYYAIQEWTKGGKLNGGKPIRSQGNYPRVAGSSGAINTFNAPPNLIRNPQFTFWDNTTTFPGYTTSSSNYDYIADDWVFTRSNNNATINLSQGVFSIGQVSVGGNPIYYLHYECTNIGAGSETFKRVMQFYQSCQVGSGQEVSVAIVAKSQTSNPITISIIQDFGTGGSPSTAVETIILSASLTPNWQRFTGKFTLPSVAGKTLGTNGDDTTQVCINYPLNAIAQVDTCNGQFHVSNVIPPFPYFSPDEQFRRLNSQVTFCLAKTGDTKFTLRPVADPGWLLLDDGTIGNPASGSTHASNQTKALFFMIWAYLAAGNPYFALYTSTGGGTVLGTSAEADWDANKRITLPASVGRVLANANGALTTSVNNSTGASTYTLTADNLPPHTHNTWYGASAAGGGSTIWVVLGPGGNPLPTSSTGAATPFSIMQPTNFLNCMIKL